ncbi:hypothetical protein A3D03_04915 [Candidatus Gottesmanbacteria bacterium RIFCSPHIGHO2_02_FULL_40_13]|uniref:Phosphomannomutase/phosphoglucomutase n=1 Tax=Candidatus Gottesmanbacteria bacterium RIFCSPHIGHO2_02_FULL_40_13 TaxID=1798384 RepID=A0A1F6AAN9_9BACT|nr:MAG: hypothetical protein A3D03_04915 [Candidatus Gottesmanbacteria bacterium RIFCSPHIGHO2_02_FULL_40_13]
MNIAPSIFRDYDIRGVYPTQVNKETYYILGRSIASYLKVKEISVGYDARLSSKELFSSLVSGLTDQGTDIIVLGMISTEMNYFASGKYGFPASIIISASHNPPQYNGLKIVKKGVVPLHGSFGLPEIKELALKGQFPQASVKGKIREMDIYNDWISHLLTFINPEKIKSLKTVVDAGNGMAGPTWKKIAQKIKLNIIPLFFEPDGHFPNHLPDPLNPRNLESLQRKIRETQADCGIALDGDADRMFAVDDKANLLSGSITCAILAEHLLSKKGPAKILYSVTSGKIVAETVGKMKGTAIKTRVGHSYIKTEMKKQNALFAGEHSGHFYFRDNYFADSSTIAGLLLLEFLAEKKAKLSHVRQKYEKYVSSGEINFEVDTTDAFLNNLTVYYVKQNPDLLDGVTVDFGSWWFNVRASKTEPLIRLNMEAENRELFKEKLTDLMAVLQELGAREK